MYIIVQLKVRRVCYHLYQQKMNFSVNTKLNQLKWILEMNSLLVYVLYWLNQLILLLENVKHQYHKELLFSEMEFQILKLK